MTLPNKLTLARLALTPVGLTLLYVNTVPYNYLCAAIIFMIAMLTDVADGYIARKYDCVTKLGTFLDPIADKLILLLHLVLLQTLGLYPLWLLLAFIARELLVDAIRNYAASQKHCIRANRSGKGKALLQTISILSALIYLSASHSQLFGISLAGAFWRNFPFYTLLAAFLVGLIGVCIVAGELRALFDEDGAPGN